MRVSALILGTALVAAMPPAHALLFTVNDAGDSGGLGCGPPAPITCTLRQAITAADAIGGNNVINFALGSQGPYAITLTSQLPPINTAGVAHNLTIDGYSQMGSVKNTNAPDQGGINATLMIEIVGASGTVGFWYAGGTAATSLTVQGLSLRGFTSPISSLMRVDLPQPVGPTTKANSPRWTSSVTRSRPMCPPG